MGIKTVLLGIASLAVVAALVACGGERAADDDGFAVETSAGASEERAAGDSAVGEPPESGDAARDVAAEGGSGGDPALAAASLDRKIIFTATLVLDVEDVAAAFSEVSTLARSAGGYVEQSSFTNRASDGDEGRRSASLRLRVPVERYDETLAELRGLPGATVRSESAKSTEVTEEYIDLDSRLRNLERTEGQYLALLERAETITDILTVSDRLDGVRAQIEQIQGRLQALDALTEMATVEVLLEPAAATPVQEQGGERGFRAGFEAAWEASLDALRFGAEAAGYAAAVAIWAVPALVLVVAGSRWLRRGRAATGA